MKLFLGWSGKKLDYLTNPKFAPLKPQTVPYFATDYLLFSYSR